MESLVSILVPCYNSANYISELLESVLGQTYSNIELIIINDGSTDETEKVIKKYEDKFNESSIKLIYKYQENAGQAAAINTALSIMKGEYLCWIDSDDYLYKDSIAVRVRKLVESGAGYFCITACDVVEEENVKKIKKKYYRRKPKGKDNFFIDAILDKNVVFASGGGFMIKTDDFIKVCPRNRIFPSREGQNWQLMLPIIYNYKCIYIEKSLYVIVERKNSHSNSFRTKEEKISRANGFNILLLNTIKEMNIEDEEFILEIVDRKYKLRMLKIALIYGDIELSKEIFSQWMNNYGGDFKVWIMYACTTNYIVKAMFQKVYNLCKK